MPTSCASPNSPPSRREWPGRGGAPAPRPGDWMLSLVESRNLRGGRLDLDGLRRVGVVRNAWSERHLLRPHDVLVTARAESVRVALTPPGVSRTAAGATVLVVRAGDPGSGLAHWLRLYLGSGVGRARILRRMTTGVATPAAHRRRAGRGGNARPVGAAPPYHSRPRGDPGSGAGGGGSGEPRPGGAGGRAGRRPRRPRPEGPRRRRTGLGSREAGVGRRRPGGFPRLGGAGDGLSPPCR